MPTIRVYQAVDLIVAGEIKFSADVGHHLNNVLRLQVGHKIIIFNGDNHAYLAEIISTNRKATIAKIYAKAMVDRESGLHLHLAQVISRKDRMDWLIRKSVELGVNEIQPLYSEKTNFKFKQTDFTKKLEHWQKIIISACEQCGRNTLQVLHKTNSVNSWLAEEHNGAKIILQPGASLTINKVDLASQKATILIGAESGFTDSELSCSSSDLI